MKGFEDAVGFVLAQEGGISNNPKDRGGLTKFGITQYRLDSVRHVSSLLPESVSDLTAAQARVVYQLAFWNPASCDSFPWPISLFLFDGCIQHGYTNGAKMLQRALWIPDDGVVGSGTKASTIWSIEGVGYAMLTLRRVFYENIVAADSTQEVFLKGWLARVENLRFELELSAPAG